MSTLVHVVLDPAFDFRRLQQGFESHGWRLISAAKQPILPGEPEHALFERAGGERAHYTFNPVCHLRVLEFAKDPDPATRAALPIVGARDIASWLASANERTLLRGILAARLTPDAAFIERIDALRNHPQAAIAGAAAQASKDIRAAVNRGDQPARAPSDNTPPQFANEQDARSVALAMVELLKAQVEPILLALARDRDGSVAAQLRPRPEDYARVFRSDVADAARIAYEAIWADTPRVMHADGGGRVDIYVAPAGMLASENDLSRHFPGGYLHIAHLLNPHRTWVRWKYLRRGETSGLAYDGLVWCDDHWAWFPKPYRVLSQVRAEA
jgi:hypothetical protein